MHPNEGQLRTYFDGGLGEAEIARMQAHLEICPSCRRKYETLQARLGQVQAALKALDPAPKEMPVSARDARFHFEAYLSTKEKIPMFQKIFAPHSRAVWAVLAVVAVLTVALSLPPVRGLANDFLGLFRIQQVSAVPFDPLNLPQNFDINDPTITQLMTENMKIETVGQKHEGVTADEASTLAGIPVRLPASPDLAGITPKLDVQPGTRLSFKVDLARIQAVLSDAGYSDLKLPKELDGSTVKAELPMIVTAVYEVNGPSGAASGNDPDMGGEWCNACTVLVQLASPTVETPDGVDLAAIGRAYLRMTGMSAADAESFSQTVDWTTTLVIPVPSFATHETVSVDGVNGILILQNPDNFTKYLLIWAKNGIVYGLNGYGDRQAALDIANSLK
jgi:Putative zinc-finger